MTQSQHTPTLEILGHDENGYYAVGYMEHDCDGTTQHVIAAEIGEKEQAAFIVRACNSHDALVEALKKVRDEYVDHNSIAYPEEKHNWPLLLEMEATIALAKGE